jgi:hypothetical protein
MKNKNTTHLFKTVLFLQFIITNIVVFGQNNLTTPSINCLISTDNFSKPPSGLYLHKPAEYFGTEINFLTYPYNFDVPKNICITQTLESLKATIVQTKKKFTNCIFFYSDAKFSNLEITDTLVLNFLELENNYKFKLYCLIPLDSTKNESKLIKTFDSISNEINSAPIPKYNNGNKEYQVYYRSITYMPTLAIKDIQHYNKYLGNKFIAETSALLNNLNKNQKLEIFYSSEITIQRASIFSFYISKNITAKVIIE